MTPVISIKESEYFALKKEREDLERFTSLVINKNVFVKNGKILIISAIGLILIIMMTI